MSLSYGGTPDSFSAASAVVSAAPLTVSTWFNPADITASTAFCSIGDTASTSDYFYLGGRGNVAGDPLQWTARGVSSGNAVSTTGFSLNTWHHACGVEISSSSRAVYIDGGGKGTDTTDVTPASLDSTATGTIIRSSNAAYFSGLIAETAIWNVALTDDQVKMLAAGVSPLRVRPDALVAYWPGYQADNLRDYSGNGNDLSTVGGAPVLADHAPVAPQWGFASPAPLYAVAAAAGTNRLLLLNPPGLDGGLGGGLSL